MNAYLASDNIAFVCDEVMHALQRANEGYAKSYGADEHSHALEARMREIFEHPTLRVFPVFNGSAANCVALAQLVQSYEAIISHYHSHIQQSECGMPEFFTGAKNLAVGGEQGKLCLAEVERLLAIAHNSGVHHVLPRVISLTQSTEIGTVYSVDEVRAVAACAKAHDLYVHMDGARVANAVASLACAPAEITWQAGVDVLSFGGTKNGAMMAEAVIFFDEALAEGFEYRRKRAGQLASKQRYIAAQLLGLLEDGVWLRHARHANEMAQLLAEGLTQRGFLPLYAVQANAVFVQFPDAVAQYLQKRGHYFYQWRLLGENVYRLVTSFATTEEEIKAFVQDCNL